MGFSPIFNGTAYPWRKKALEKLIATDDAAGMEEFLKKFPKAIEWEQVRGPNHQTYFHKAVQDQKYAAAEVLLEHGARIDQLGIGGGTILMHALRISFNGQPDMNALDEAFVLKLLAKGADINKPDCRDFPPLKTAAWKGNAALVKFLLAHGADPDTAEKDGTTVLMDMAGHTGWRLSAANAQAVAAALLAGGADVHRQTDRGMTALFFAKDIPTAEMLLERGADPGHKDKTGRLAWEVEGNLGKPVARHLQKTAEAAALERQVEESLQPVLLPKSKPLVLKKNP